MTFEMSISFKEIVDMLHQKIGKLKLIKYDKFFLHKVLSECLG